MKYLSVARLKLKSVTSVKNLLISVMLLQPLVKLPWVKPVVAYLPRPGMNILVSIKTSSAVMFLKQYQTKNITPYVHSFAFHVPEFIAKFSSVCRFNQQGLEKLNDVTTQQY